MAEPLRLGLLSTARINRRILAPARQSGLVDVVAVGSRERRTAEPYAREHGIERAHGSYEALLADPGIDAVYIPAAELAARGVVPAGARGGQARPLREAAVGPTGGGRGPLRSRRAERPRPRRGVHVPAQPADPAARRARSRGNDRPAAARPHVVHLPPRARARHPPRSRAGRRLGARSRRLLRERHPPARRRARDRFRAARARPDRGRRALHRQSRPPRRGSRPLRLRAPRAVQGDAHSGRRATAVGPGAQGALAALRRSAAEGVPVRV